MGNNKYKILLVDNDLANRNVVQDILESSDYQVILADNCAMAVAMYSSYVPDLIILETVLPDRDGSVFLKNIRKTSLVPIIVLSARTEEGEKVSTLDAGANDYITKPFGSEELLARVRVALRSKLQYSGSGYNCGSFVSNELTVNYAARQVFISEREIKLTQTEYNIVAFLSENSGKMMTYKSIIKAIWGYPDEGSIKKLQVNMANIRKKFGNTPECRGYIVNELGVGYRMDGEMKQIKTI